MDEEKEEEEVEREAVEVVVMGGGPWRSGEKGAWEFTVTKCRGQAGCAAEVLIREACSAHVARTLTLK